MWCPTLWWTTAPWTPTTSSTCPIWSDFNAQNGTHIASIAAIHVEPMGLYGGKQTTLDALSTSAQ
ncbi:MAG: hypothetical protein ACLUNQ_01585 [Oscillospiraceae bacterium]